MNESCFTNIARYIVLLAVIPFLSACIAFKPTQLTYKSIQTATMSQEVRYGVYTPPNWQKGESLPLIVFLHGGGGSEASIEKHQAHHYLDEKMSKGLIPRAIVVTPDGGNGFWENWHDGSRQYRDWVVKEIMPRVQLDYATMECPEHCHLAGISMGGFGVLRFAYYHRNLFSSVSAISSPLFSDKTLNQQASSWLVKLFFPLEKIFGPQEKDIYRKENPYNAWVDDPELSKIRLQLIWGNRDSAKILAANESFQQRLETNSIKHEYYVYQGGHKWRYWVPQFDRIFNFLLKK